VTEHPPWYVPAVSARSAPDPTWRLLWRRWPGRVTRLALGLLPLLWLFRWIRPHEVAANARRAGMIAMTSAFAIQMVSQLFVVERWRSLLVAYGADRARLPNRSTLLRHVFVGLYYAVLPTGVVGDALRARRVSDCLPSPSSAYVVVFVERVAALAALLLVAAVTAWLVPSGPDGAVLYALNVGLVLALVLASASLVLPQFTRQYPRVGTLLERVPIVGSALARIPAAQSLGGLARAVAFSVATQVLVIVSVAMLIAPLDAAATPAVCARVVPAIVLVTTVPLTPGGVGQREVAFVELFRAAGVVPASALAASLLTFGLVVGLALVGGVVLLVERVSQKP